MTKNPGANRVKTSEKAFSTCGKSVNMMRVCRTKPIASLLTDFLLKVLGEKFDEPKSSPATPSSHAAMGKS